MKSEGRLSTSRVSLNCKLWWRPSMAFKSLLPETIDFIQGTKVILRRLVDQYLSTVRCVLLLHGTKTEVLGTISIGRLST
jgi:hypothetical protein